MSHPALQLAWRATRCTATTSWKLLRKTWMFTAPLLLALLVFICETAWKLCVGLFYAFCEYASETRDEKRVLNTGMGFDSKGRPIRPGDESKLWIDYP